MVSPSYLAGFLDGEGSFAVIGGSIAVRVTNTHRGILEAIQEVHGGSIVVHTEGELFRRNAWQWRVFGQDAEAVINLTLPLLREKRTQAFLLLEYRRVDPSDPIRKWIQGALKSLKRLEY